MSVRALATVLDFAPTHWTSGTRLVAIALADHVNHEGHAWPTLDTLARRAGVHVRSVQRHLRQLEADGWIERHTRYIDGKQHANLWTWRMWITIPGVTPVSPGGRHTRHPNPRGTGVTPVSPRTTSTNHQQNQRPSPPTPVDD